MNKVQYCYILEQVQLFNRLAHTDSDRQTEEYYIKACNMVEEEYVNEFKPWYDKYKELDSKDNLIQVADGIGDTLVVCIQAVEINSPSSLNFEYINLLRSSKVYTKYKDVFIAPMAHVLDVGEDLGLDVFSIAKEICRSNLTKIPTLDQVMQYYGDGYLHEGIVDEACTAAVEWTEGQIGTDFQVSYKIKTDIHGVDRVVFCDQYGKIRKPWTYEEPQLGGLV